MPRAPLEGPSTIKGAEAAAGLGMRLVSHFVAVQRQREKHLVTGVACAPAGGRLARALVAAAGESAHAPSEGPLWEIPRLTVLPTQLISFLWE